MLEEELLAGESVVFWTDERLCLPRRRFDGDPEMDADFR